MTKLEAEKVKKLDKTATILAPRPQENQHDGWWISFPTCVTGRFAEAIKEARF